MRIEYQPGSFIETDFDQFIPKPHVIDAMLHPHEVINPDQPSRQALDMYGSITQWIHTRYDSLVGQDMMKNIVRKRGKKNGTK